jgi:hypothetical protein
MSSTRLAVSPPNAHEHGGSRATPRQLDVHGGSDDSSEGTVDSSAPPSPLVRHALLSSSKDAYRASRTAPMPSPLSDVPEICYLGISTSPPIDPVVFQQAMDISSKAKPGHNGDSCRDENEIEWTEEDRLAKELEKEEPLLQDNPDR